MKNKDLIARLVALDPEADVVALAPGVGTFEVEYVSVTGYAIDVNAPPSPSNIQTNVILGIRKK